MQCQCSTAIDRRCGHRLLSIARTDEFRRRLPHARLHNNPEVDRLFKYQYQLYNLYAPISDVTHPTLVFFCSLSVARQWTDASAPAHYLPFTAP